MHCLICKRARWYWQDLFVYQRLREPKYELLIKKREDAGIKHFMDLNTFTECSNTMATILMTTTQTEKEKF